ncbi:response regulator [Lichenihabitans psoromatis]|uniref:response regulator n=1 Tax=Lichenihabitans psoromatis TaxID=2528642 RepID=UPI00103853CE|nr:response regulator [Lichenihabitans psoromatis]
MTSIPDQAGALVGRTILLIEDDPLVGVVVVDHLEDAGAIVVGPVTTIADALEVIAGDTVFDAAMLDAHLQDGSARDIIAALVLRGTPYVLVTGDENFGLAYSANAPCVPKPANMGKVTQLLASLLAEQDSAEIRPPAANLTPPGQGLPFELSASQGLDAASHDDLIGQHGAVTVGTLRKIYGESFAHGSSPDAQLADVMAGLDAPSWSWLTTAHASGNLAGAILMAHAPGPRG